MRFTRAAKVAAFPLTALILVALVACQGPAGLDGAAGAKGDQGASGSPGSSGISALEAIGGAGHRTTVVAAYISNTDRGEIGPLHTIDLTKYFRGGKAQVTFTVGAPPAGSTFTVSIAKGSTVATVKLRDKAAKVADPTDYMLPGFADAEATVFQASTVTYFTVTATDADKFTATKTLAVLANRKPVVPADADETEWTLPDPPADSTAAATDEFYPIGTQNEPDTRRDGGTKDERDGTAAEIAAAQKGDIVKSCGWRVKRRAHHPLLPLSKRLPPSALRRRMSASPSRAV